MGKKKERKKKAARVQYSTLTVVVCATVVTLSEHCTYTTGVRARVSLLGASLLNARAPHRSLGDSARHNHQLRSGVWSSIGRGTRTSHTATHLFSGLPVHNLTHPADTNRCSHDDKASSRMPPSPRRLRLSHLRLFAAASR